MLFPARIISGIGTGYVFTRIILIRLQLSQITIGGWFIYRITLQICPIYIAEVAPKERRGILVAMVNAVGSLGIVVR